MIELQDKKVLVIDDDQTLQKLMEYALLQEGAKVAIASDGSEGLHKFYTDEPDLIILDIMMPHMDGRETCRHIRQYSKVPIVMLTAMGQDVDVVQALDNGVDDYVTKPFTVNVLLARIRAVLRRSDNVSSAEPICTYSDDYLSIDLKHRRILTNGKPIKLTATEHRLLAYLLENAGQVLTFKQILENVWGWEYQDNIDYVHVYISHLRRKLEETPKKPRYFLTEHGLGYRFDGKFRLGSS